MRRTPTVAYYVSAHGFGHGVRSCDIISRLHALHPGFRIRIVSALEEDFFRSRLRALRPEVRAAELDVGLVQTDSVTSDVPATLDRLLALDARHDELVRREQAFLSSSGVDLLVADIPGIPFEAAHRLGIPRLAVGNLCWNWIYGQYAAQDARWRGIIRRFEDAYRLADLLLRLPFSGDMSVFPRAEDVNLLASPGVRRREELADSLGIDPSSRLVLLSFTSLAWDGRALRAAAAIEGCEFLQMRPLALRAPNIRTVDRERFPFSDVIASVDAVLSKPGYGILSDCIVNDVPLLFTERAGFVEYEVLVRAIRRYLRHVFVPVDDFYAGRIGPYLAGLASLPAPPERMPADGAALAARRIAEFAAGSRQEAAPCA